MLCFYCFYKFNKKAEVMWPYIFNLMNNGKCPTFGTQYTGLDGTQKAKGR